MKFYSVWCNINLKTSTLAKQGASLQIKSPSQCFPNHYLLLTTHHNHHSLPPYHDSTIPYSLHNLSNQAHLKPLLYPLPKFNTITLPSTLASSLITQYSPPPQHFHQLISLLTTFLTITTPQQHHIHLPSSPNILSPFHLHPHPHFYLFPPQMYHINITSISLSIPIPIPIPPTIHPTPPSSTIIPQIKQQTLNYPAAKDKNYHNSSTPLLGFKNKTRRTCVLHHPLKRSKSK